jgi:diaminopimelate decarboxylase
MAALTLKESFRGDEVAQLESIGKFAAERLPKYAVPIFIRVQPEMEITGTYKHRKVEMQRDGIDPTVIKDKMYWFVSGKGYQPFGQKEFQDIVGGRVKL